MKASELGARAATVQGSAVADHRFRLMTTTTRSSIRSGCVPMVALLVASCGGGGGSSSSVPNVVSPESAGEAVEDALLPSGDDPAPIPERAPDANVVSDAVRQRVLESMDSVGRGYGPGALFDGWQCFNLGDSEIGRSTFHFSYSASDGSGLAPSSGLAGLAEVEGDRDIGFTVSVTDETTVLVDYAELSAQDEWTDIQASSSAGTHSLSFDSLIFVGRVSCSSSDQESAEPPESEEPMDSEPDPLDRLEALFVRLDKEATLLRLQGDVVLVFGPASAGLPTSRQTLTFSASDLTRPEDPASTSIRLSTSSDYYSDFTCVVVNDDSYELVRCIGRKPDASRDYFQFDLSEADVRESGELAAEGSHVECVGTDFRSCLNRLVDPETSSDALLRVPSE